MKLSNKNKTLVSLLQQDKYRMDILIAVSQIETRELWISGGFVRNLVWDSLHKYRHRTELGDIDVFYYDKNIIDEGEEMQIIRELYHLLPNVNWSVKNQARMHYYDDNLQYMDLNDALSKFPDTSSAVAVRLDKENNIHVISPFGLNDLFSLTLKPTPHSRKNKITYERYLLRQINKKWKKNWPLLQIKK